MPVVRRYRRRRTTRPLKRRRISGRGAYRTRRAPARRTVRRKAPVRRRAAPRRKSLAGKAFAVADIAADFLPYGSYIKAATSIGRTISGMGDYRVNSNSLISKWTSNGPPEIVNVRAIEGGVVIRHREYLGDLDTASGTPTPFTVSNAFYLNPGVSATFPWLSQIAQGFEQYKFNGLIFEYKTLSVDAIAASTVNVGAVIVATEYNVLHPLFTSKQSMENYEFCSSGKPSVSIIHPVECAPSQTPLTKMFVRNNVIPTTGDLRMYDLGITQFATQGLPTTASSIGEIWVSYEVELFKPNIQNFATGPSSLTASVAMFYNNYSATGWTGLNNGGLAGPFGYTMLTQTAAAFGAPLLKWPSPAGGYSTVSYIPEFLFVNKNRGGLVGFIDTNIAAEVQDFTDDQPGTIALVGRSDIFASVNSVIFSLDTVPHLYLFDCVWSNTVAGAVAFPTTGTAGGVDLSAKYPTNFAAGGQTVNVPAAAASATRLCYQIYAYVPAASVSQTWGSWFFNNGTGGGPTGTAWTMDMHVTRVF